MTRRPGFLKTALILSLIALSLYVGLQLAASQATSQAIQMVRTRLGSAGIRSEWSFEQSRFTLPRSWTGLGFAGKALIPKPGPWGPACSVSISAEEVRVTPHRGLTDWSVDVTKAVIVVEPQTAKDMPHDRVRTQTIYFRSLRLPVRVRVTRAGNIDQDIHKWTSEIAAFLQTGRTPLDIRFDGKFMPSVEGQRGELRIRSRRESGQTRLTLERDDIKKIGDLTEEGLTEAEVDVLLENPAKAPRLLMIQREASAAARALVKKTRDFPGDAYRHVLWSYLLTKAYGAEFALRITDAHEAGENKTDDTPEDHAMDLHNNRIGIEYASSGVEEADIAWKVVSDPRIIRSSQ